MGNEKETGALMSCMVFLLSPNNSSLISRLVQVVNVAMADVPQGSFSFLLSPLTSRLVQVVNVVVADVPQGSFSFLLSPFSFNNYVSFLLLLLQRKRATIQRP